MSGRTRTSLWIAGTTAVTALIAWGFSYAGASFIHFVLELRLPSWLYEGHQPLLRWDAIGLFVAFVLAFLAVRLWSAPPELWLGAAATSLVFAGRYAIDLISLRHFSAGGDEVSEVLHQGPFGDPTNAAFALLGLPLVIGLACWLAWRRRTAAVASQAPQPHA